MLYAQIQLDGIEKSVLRKSQAAKKPYCNSWCIMGPHLFSTCLELRSQGKLSFMNVMDQHSGYTGFQRRIVLYMKI